nr:glycosyltransferase [Lentisphaeria bacterium]
MNQQKLLGVRFDTVTRPQAMERLLELAQNAQTEDLPAQLIVTVNVQILVIARHRYPSLLPVINTAPLVVADGAPLVVLSRIFGPRLPERVAGSDLIFDI